MIDFVPIEYHYEVLVYFLFFLVLANLLHAYTLDLKSEKNIKFLRTFGWLLFILMTLYLGLRPHSTYFGDMGSYSGYFRSYQAGAPITTDKDVFFHYYMKFTSLFTTQDGFFLITEFLYIFPMLLISKINFKQFWFYSFFMFLASFSFYSYGVNGIRNGLATSFFLWGLCYKDNKKIMILFFLIAILFHKTQLLPVAALGLTYVYNNPKTYLKAWFISIPMSLFLGSLFVTLFTSLGFGDDRLAGYLTGNLQADTRFRWDFLFYSSFPVFAGWFFIFKKKFHDTFYFQVYNVYLICNSFWILVIRANFSNRFAYLSWFIMAFIIIYPLLKKHFFKNQQVVIAKVILAYFMFTYLMFLKETLNP